MNPCRDWLEMSPGHLLCVFERAFHDAYYMMNYLFTVACANSSCASWAGILRLLRSSWWVKSPSNFHKLPRASATSLWPCLPIAFLQLNHAVHVIESNKQYNIFLQWLILIVVASEIEHLFVHMTSQLLYFVHIWYMTLQLCYSFV